MILLALANFHFAHVRELAEQSTHVPINSLYLWYMMNIYFSLDILLDGGLYTSEVTEIAGDVSAGKTQVKHIIPCL